MNMNKMISALMLFVLMTGFALAIEVPVQLTTARLDGTNLDKDVTNSLSLERGTSFELRVVLETLPIVDYNLNNVEVEARLSGYEYGSISETLDLFDMKPGVSYVKTFDLELPGNMDSEEYLLRIRVSGRNMEDKTFYYNLMIDSARHQIRISDFSLNPSNSVEAGYSVIGRIYVENTGDRKQKDVKATLSIPELGLEDTQYLKSIDSDDSDFFEDMMVFIPACTPEGTYKVVAEVEYDRSTRKVSEERTLRVGASEICQDEKEETTKITVLDKQALEQGGSATYPITIENKGSTAKTYNVQVGGLAWGTAVVEPGTVVFVKAGESKKVYVHVTADKKAPVGESIFAVTITSDKDQEILSFIADVSEAESNITLRNVLEILLIVLVAILIIVGLVIGFRKAKSSEDEEKTYY